MTKELQIQSKVLVHETDTKQMQSLKTFFDENNLIGLKAEHYHNIVETLSSNIDLGAIFLAEEEDVDGKSGLEIALEIQKMRPELPIILRCDPDIAEQIDPKYEFAYSETYVGGDYPHLKKIIEKYLFNTFYPSSFIRGIEEISTDALRNTFQQSTIISSAPYLIRDRLIYGQLFSMIALEGGWCRGYMMLQSTENTMIELIEAKKTALSPERVDFRRVNNLMSEITNMIWGTLKSRFFTTSSESDTIQKIQVPIVVDHTRGYISFGSEDPQLSFKYVIQDQDGNLPQVEMYQKFIFHLNWSPDEFKETPEVVEDLVQAGELEFF